MDSTIQADQALALFILFFFSSRRRHTRCSRDWSSDVCSSDLVWVVGLGGALVHFDGTTWRSTGSGLGDFNGVRGTSSSDVLAVSQSTITGAGRIYHFDGVSWNLNATIGGGLADVFSVSSREAYVSG